MNLSNPLPAAWKAILCANEAVKITRRVIVRSPGHSNEECQQALHIFQQGLRKETLYQGNEALRLLEDETATPSLEMIYENLCLSTYESPSSNGLCGNSPNQEH